MLPWTWGMAYRVMPVSIDMNPTIQCMGCHQAVCSGDCFATHRTRFGCHNQNCVYHKACPLPPGPEPTETAETDASPPEEATADGTTTSSIDGVSQEGDLVYRETITREYRLVNGQFIQLPGQYTHATTSGGLQTGQGLSGATAAARMVVSEPIPVDIPREEIDAQERLFSEFQNSPQDHHNQSPPDQHDPSTSNPPTHQEDLGHQSSGGHPEPEEEVPNEAQTGPSDDQQEQQSNSTQGEISSQE